MTWLLRLYPGMWRRRYGPEVAAMLAGRGFSLRTAVDLIAGAIDVRLHPAATLAAASAAAPSATEETSMLTRILRLDCRTAYGPNLTKADQWRANAWMLGSTLILTAMWMAMHVRFHDDPIIDSLGVMPFMIGLLLSMRYTYLKGRSAAVQAIFIGGLTLLLTAFFVVIGLIASRI